MSQREKLLENQERRRPSYISTDIIINTCGQLFNEISLDEDQYYIEKQTRRNPDLFRLILTPSGPIALSSSTRETVWEMDFNSEKGKCFLNTMQNEMKSRESNHLPSLVKAINIAEEEDTFFLRLLPYDDQRSSELLINELEIKIAKAQI